MSTVGQLAHKVASVTIAVSMALTVIGIPVAFGADAVYPPGIISTKPPVVPNAVVVIIPPKRSNTVLEITPVAPTAKNLLSLSSFSKNNPVAVGSVIVGGIKKDEDITKSKIRPKDGTATEVQTTSGTPTGVTVGGFQPRGSTRYQYLVTVTLYVSGKFGVNPLGRYIVNDNGEITLPSVVLESGGSATFEIIETKTTAGVRAGDPRVTIVNKKVVVSVRATAVAAFSTTQVKRK